MKYYQRDYFNFTCKLEDFTLGKCLIKTPTYRKLTLPVTDGKNKLYVTLMDFGKTDKIYYRDTNNRSISIDWNDRQYVNINKEVHFSQVYSIGKNKFMTSYDFMEKLLELLTLHHDDMMNCVLEIRGEVTRTKNNGTVYTNYNIRHLNLIATRTSLIFKREVSILIKPNALIENENKFIVKGYTQVKQNKQVIYLPEKFVIDFNCYDDGTIEARKTLYRNIFNFEEDKVVSVLLDVRLDKERVIEEMTEGQKLLIDLGLMTLEETIAENTHSTKNIQNSIVKPLLKGQYGALSITLDKKALQNIIFEN